MQNLIKAILKNWQYKLLAVLVAIGLWYYVAREQNLSIQLNAPVELLNYPKHMKIANKDFRGNVDITIEGRRDIINKISRNSVKVQIDITETKPGRNIYIITGNRVSGIPRGLYIKDISPSRINIDFEKVSE